MLKLAQVGIQRFSASGDAGPHYMRNVCASHKSEPISEEFFPLVSPRPFGRTDSIWVLPVCPRKTKGGLR